MTTRRAAAGSLRGWRQRVLLAALVAVASLLTVAQAASANVTTIKFDPTRQGWRGDLPNLKPPGYQQFDTPVSGQVYGEPLVWNNTVVVGTEGDVAYGIDRTTGAITWAQSLGTPEPATATNCTDAVFPQYGSTATPVIDPATGIVYFVARTWDGSNPGSATYRAFAFNATTGALQPGWPITIGGTASNDSSSTFDPTVELQRTGILLQGGRIFFGFSSFCDLGAYKGWISGISTGTRSQSMWVDETGGNIQGGIWQSGGGFASDGTSMYVASGNGTPPSPGPGTTPQGALGQSTFRLTVDGNGNLQQADRFTPFNANQLNSIDGDVGAGGPTLLPDNFGTVPGHPHLLVQSTKQTLYLLDRDNLGGMAGPNGPDNVVSELPNQPAFSHAAVWPGDGGLFYLTSPLRAFRVAPTGALSLAGAAANFSPDRSGPPIITSNGTTAGSATLWQINQQMGQLQAYNPVPVNGTLQLLWSAPINSGALGTKFAVAAADGNNVIVGSDGHVIEFKAPQAPSPAPVVSSPQFGVPNQTDTFSVAPDGAVQVRWVTGSGPWSGPLAISPPGVAPPGARLAASNQFGIPNQTDVFVVGTNGAVQVLWVQGAGAWNGPLAISPAGMAPAGAGVAPSNQFGISNQTDVFVVGTNGAAQVVWVQGQGAWLGPLSISPTGMAPAGAGVAASNQFGISNQTDVFVVGNNGTQVMWVEGQGSWLGPMAISSAGLAPAGAALTASNQFGIPNQTDVFVVGASGAVQVLWVDGGGAWNVPLAVSAPGAEPVGAALASSNQFGIPNQTDVFVVGASGSAQVLWVDGAGSWNGPLAISPRGLAPPGAGLAAANQQGIPNQTDVWVVDDTGATDVVWVQSGGPWFGPQFT